MYYSKYTEDMYAWGVKLVLCGKQTTPKEVAARLNDRRREFITSLVYDRNGDLSEIHYEKNRK